MEDINPATMQLAIKELQKEVRALKGKVTKLSNKKNQYDAQGFYEQLAAIDNKVNNFAKEIVGLNRDYYRQQCFNIRETASNIFHDTGHPPKIPLNMSQIAQSCANEIQGYYLQYCERISNCLNADDMRKAFDDYVKEVNQALQNRRYPPIKVIK